MTSNLFALPADTAPIGVSLTRQTRIARPGCGAASRLLPRSDVEPAGKGSGPTLAPTDDPGADPGADPAVAPGVAPGVVPGVDSGPAGRSVAVARWEADWGWWSSRPEGRRSVDVWVGRHSCLAGLESLQSVLEACGADRSIEVDVADRRLAAVVSEAAGGDAAGARVVLQRVMPGLVTRAAARSRRHGMPLDTILDELMATAWTVIREYPVQRRPSKVAVNIIMDSEYRWFRSTSTPFTQPVPVAPDELSRYQPVHGAGDEASSWGQPERVLGELPQILLEAVRQGFDGADARLLIELFVLDRGVTEIAARDGVSQRRVRQRRQDAIRRLTRHVNRPVRHHDPSPSAVSSMGSSLKAGGGGEVVDRD